MALNLKQLAGYAPSRLRRAFLTDQSDGMKRRRQVIGLSLAGMASMTAVTLLQTGIVRHLPDPPIKGFDSDKVNLSEAAFQFGVPDGTLSLASLAANLPLAAFGPPDRAVAMPWVPIAAAAKSVVDAATGAWYFYQMPTREKAWCAYCIAGAVINFGILACTLPEALKAARSL